MAARLTYYKATTPNGTDFWSGTIDYAAALETGEIIEHRATMIRDDPSTYLSVSIHPTNCTGMRWPCRLFVVEPVGPHQPCKRISHKVICSALRVIEERPAHEALGPQGEQVAATIERAARLTSDEAERLNAAWKKDVAWSARAEARAAVRAEARADAARAAAWFDAACDAAWDAALALLTRDLISSEHFKTLYGPWREVIGDE